MQPNNITKENARTIKLDNKKNKLTKLSETVIWMLCKDCY